MFEEELPKRPAQEFPLKLEGMSVAAMREYLVALDEEKARVQAEIDKRGGVKAAAEALFS